jgi:glycosyltransferase involved in cell wall biosynthesis
VALPCYLLGGMLAAWRLCRRRRYDIVHVHWPMPHALFGWVARAACGARLVVTFYGVELRWVKSKMTWLKGFLARAATSADRVVAISAYTAKEIRELADVPITVIPYTTGLTEAAEAERRPGPPSPFPVLFVGRLVARKGVSTLLEAVKRLAPSLGLQVSIIGDGPERPALDAQVAREDLRGVVTMRGKVPSAELLRAYRQAGVLVLPAVVDARGDTEGLGVVLLEAMSCGTPVVASDIGGITDIVTQEETGLLVPPGDPAALASAIRRLATDAALWRRLAEAGRRRFREDFGWTAIARRWEEVYRAAVSPPARAAPSSG